MHGLVVLAVCGILAHARPDLWVAIFVSLNALKRNSRDRPVQPRSPHSHVDDRIDSPCRDINLIRVTNYHLNIRASRRGLHFSSSVTANLIHVTVAGAR